MSQKETIAIMEAISDEHNDRWEQTRMISYVQAVSQGAKYDKPQDFLKFSWDVDTISNGNVDFVMEQFETLKWAKDAINAKK